MSETTDEWGRARMSRLHTARRAGQGRARGEQGERIVNEPTCRSCWLATLADDERARAAAEPITSCVYLCHKHQLAMDTMLASLPPIRYVNASARHEFFTTPAPAARACPDDPADVPGEVSE